MKDAKRDIRKCNIGIIGFVMLILASCVTNDGDIGPLYGQWALTDMTIDSESAEIDVNLYFWRFQNDIIKIQRYEGNNHSSSCVGTWKRSDDDLYLNFTHMAAQEGSENWDFYNPPPELGIPGREISLMKIERLTNKDMILMFAGTDGKTYRYTFKKLI